MVSAYKYLYERIRRAYGEREARAIALLVLEKRCGLSVTDVCMGRDEMHIAQPAADCAAKKKNCAAENFKKAAQTELDAVARRLLRDEPVQYVLGEADFCGRSFAVTRDVLIPRPETEELARMAAEAARSMRASRILDIGTGSGCIAITLAKEAPASRVTAIDISPAAIRVAKKNAQRWEAQITFEETDILREAAEEAEGIEMERYDIIVSNPPYVCRSERAEMGVNVRDYEPDKALFVPDADPLVFCRAIAWVALRRLSAGGRLFVEINSRFGKEVSELFRRAGFGDVEIRKDMQGLDRFLICRQYEKDN